MKRFKALFLLVGFIIFAAIWKLSSLEPALTSGLALFALIAWLWVTEAMHISITALLVPLMAMLLGIFDVSEALVSFAHPILFLFMGGFVLAGALHHHGLDHLIAARLLRLSGGRLLWSSWIVFGLTAFLSMWISNTATVAIMIPLVLSLLSNLDQKDSKPIFLYFLLGTAYSGSIGGMATVIGSPPNAIAASTLEISFLEWMQYGVPMALLALPILAALLYFVFRPPRELVLAIPVNDKALTRDRFKVLIIFLLSVLGWITSTSFADLFGIQGNSDAVVAIMAIVLIGATKSLSWKEMSASVNWGVLILFGGGITLSAVLTETGSSRYLAENIKILVEHAPLFLLLFAAVTFVIFLTELVSNTASAALIIPIFSVLATSLGLDPKFVIIAVAFAASCAFMLPVATPPNALVYATGYVAQSHMMKFGIVLNLTMGLLIATLALVVV
jgi:solute carrier family 13 (sodium-dependent dicarboxylate transporter), member 2/3/5